MKAGERIGLLREAGLSPKKSFGQNFLVSDGVIASIALASVPDAELGHALVVELGAGLGALTAALCLRARRVVAVERDRDLVPILERSLAEPIALGTLTVREGDAQTVDVAGLMAGAEGTRVLAGNLPYQITGQLLRMAVDQASAVDRVVFMVQEEVADRLVASPSTKAYGALTVFVRAAFDVRVVLHVPAGAFVPAPNVASAVVLLTPQRPPRAHETDTFRALVKAAFSMRRKTLRNAWRAVSSDDVRIAAAARSAEVSLDARGETLDVNAFARMAAALDYGVAS